LPCPPVTVKAVMRFRATLITPYLQGDNILPFANTKHYCRILEDRKRRQPVE
jgi:hypothetical protein